ncbi:MAG: hypothetical protein WA496_08000 [Candidatus Udaeobacter sp.]
MALTDTKLQTFAPELYQDIWLNDLVMYSVYVLAESKNEINAEEIGREDRGQVGRPGSGLNFVHYRSGALNH